MRHPLAGIELGIWATEAERCPICLKGWTPEEIDTRDARVISHLPRKLACAECLVQRGALALRVDLGFDAQKSSDRKAAE